MNIKYHSLIQVSIPIDKQKYSKQKYRPIMSGRQQIKVMRENEGFQSMLFLAREEFKWGKTMFDKMMGKNLKLSASSIKTMAVEYAGDNNLEIISTHSRKNFKRINNAS